MHLLRALSASAADLLNSPLRSPPSPAGIGEQWVLTPLSHVAVVVAMVHSLWSVVGGQRVVWRVLSRSGSAPLAHQGLLCTVRAVNVVAEDPRLAGLGHGHVEHAAVVLGPREVLLWATVGGTGCFVCTSFRGVVIGDRGNIGNPGLEAASSWSTVTAADAGGGRRRLSILMSPERGKRWLFFWKCRHNFSFSGVTSQVTCRNSEPEQAVLRCRRLLCPHQQESLSPPPADPLHPTESNALPLQHPHLSLWSALLQLGHSHRTATHRGLRRHRCMDELKIRHQQETHWKALKRYLVSRPLWSPGLDCLTSWLFSQRRLGFCLIACRGESGFIFSHLFRNQHLHLLCIKPTFSF